MSVLTEEQCAEIRKRANAATFGPWRWFGSPMYPYLATVTGGRVYVMRFERSGMRSAMVSWQGGRASSELHGMVKTKDLAIKERDYRDDLERIDHPDAELIAHSRQDIEDLLDTIDALRDAARLVPWDE